MGGFVMESSLTLDVEVTFAWWLTFYTRGVVFVALLFDVEPDWVKVGKVIRRAIRVRVAKCPR
jgi:hypothetical protein